MASRRASRYVLLFLARLESFTLAAYPEVNDDGCNCYLTSGSSAHYFTTHEFFDFRSLKDHARVPPIIPDASQSSDALATSDYFLRKEWNEYWGIQQWNNSDSVENGLAPVLMVHSPNNIYIEENRDENAASDTFMTLRTLRLKNYQSASEVESISQAYHYMSVRMLARTLGAPGAVTAMFTYKDSGDGNDLNHVQESDLEIRTRDPPETVQYTNQPSYGLQGLDVPEATRNVTMPAQLKRSDWAVHRMDWTPTSTTWLINDEEVTSIDFQTPKDPSMLIFNSWSDGGDWTGNMTVGDEAFFQIQWIELVYNSTGTAKTTDKYSRSAAVGQSEKREEGSCYNVCSIDETTKTGTPVLLQGSASRLREHVSGYGNVGFWIPLLLTALLCF